jgi:hypothetical protein
MHCDNDHPEDQQRDDDTDNDKFEQNVLALALPSRQGWSSDFGGSSRFMVLTPNQRHRLYGLF